MLDGFCYTVHSTRNYGSNRKYHSAILLLNLNPVTGLLYGKATYYDAGKANLQQIIADIRCEILNGRFFLPKIMNTIFIFGYILSLRLYEQLLQCVSFLIILILINTK